MEHRFVNRTALSWTALFLLLITLPVYAADPVLWIPPEEIWTPYRADPLEPRNGVTILGISDSAIPGAGDRRFHLEIGGTFAFLEWSAGETRWQTAASAGFRGQFDQEHSQDNVGWDGIYGLLVFGELSPRLTVKSGIMHTSSHIGDELIERTGRERIGYTRQELVAAASWLTHSRARFYGEVAWGFDLRNETLQEPGRMQTGLEWLRPRGTGWDWFGAVNLGAFEEHDWDPDLSVETGIEVLRVERRWRIAVSYHDGRVPLGELTPARERWIGIGVLLDP